MPTTTVTHEPWCEDHVTECGWNMCNTAAVDFGQIDKDGFAAGSLWLAQDEHEGNDLKVAGSFGPHSFRVDEGAARAFLAAVREDPDGLISALANALGRIDGGSTADPIGVEAIRVELGSEAE